MSKNTDKKKEREFQYDLTKVQVDLGIGIAIVIGMLAIAYGLLSYYKDDALATEIIVSVVIPFGVIALLLIYWSEERAFKRIKEKYISIKQQETKLEAQK